MGGRHVHGRRDRARGAGRRHDRRAGDDRMTAFGDAVRKWTLNVEAGLHDVFVNTAVAVLDSIRDGSIVTGAPGQPVQTGTLRGSWQLTFPSPTTAMVFSGGAASAYNWQIEDGVSWRGTPLTLRSQVGGFHSVQLTIMNFDRLVYAVAHDQPTGRALDRPRD